MAQISPGCFICFADDMHPYDCGECGQTWPCDADRLSAQLAEQRSINAALTETAWNEHVAVDESHLCDADCKVANFLRNLDGAARLAQFAPTRDGAMVYLQATLNLLHPDHDLSPEQPEVTE